MRINESATQNGSPALHILIADDNLDEAELMRIAFRKAGITAKLTFVQDGRQVKDFLLKHGNLGPDLLVLDLKMPGCDGFEVLEWLRDTPPLNRTPVIVFSGSDQPVDINRALSLGASRYLVKPQKLPDLVQMVSGIYRFAIKLQTDDLQPTHNHGGRD